MHQGPVDKLGYVPCDTQSKKLVSVETRTNQDFTKDSIKLVPSKQTGSSALRITKSHTFLNDKLSYVGAPKQNVLLNQDKYSKLIRPKNLPRRPGNDTKTNSIVKAFKIYLDPKAAQTVSPPGRIQHVYSSAVAFTMTDEMHTFKEEHIKGADIEPIFVENNTGNSEFLK